MADEEAPKEVKRDPDDILKDWFKARVVSSFKCKPEAADALVNNEASRVAVETFLNNETSQRLLVFSNPDLMAVRADPMRLSEATRVTIADSRERLPSSSVHAVGSDPFTIATALFLRISRRVRGVRGSRLVVRRATEYISDTRTILTENPKTHLTHVHGM
jgi:hypothetical protein